MPEHDAIIIGAGMSGLYQLHRLRALGMKVLVLEAGTGVGGTWYWNRYPGARFDSESYSYGYSWSKELLEDWNWSEHFAPQPETERYLNHVADRFDLRRDIRFQSRVASAHWNEAAREWRVALADGTGFTCRFLVTAVGPLSAPVKPRIAGRDDFAGEAYYTALWPKHEVSFAGKRVAVIGTGATGVQTIQEVAKTCASLTVFQRTPNWCAPLHNARISAEEMARIRAGYPDIFARCQETFGCFVHTADPRRTFDVPAEVREAFWEKLYGEPGFGIWVGNFMDMLTDPEANAAMSAFIARKIRARVNDPAVAEKLIPKNHGFGTRRVPLETRYYEVYNQPNVRLVDISETPIARITATGIETAAETFAFDMIVFATGFDALTGSFDRIDIRGTGDRPLRAAWQGGPKTFMGMQVAGFPNLLMLLGPHTALGNIPRSIEYNVDWVSNLLAHLRARGITRVEPTEAAQAAWHAVVQDSAKGLLSNEISSWFTGVNTNVDGKDQRILARYSGSAPEYRRRCDAVAAGGYRELVLDPSSGDIKGGWYETGITASPSAAAALSIPRRRAHDAADNRNGEIAVNRIVHAARRLLGTDVLARRLETLESALASPLASPLAAPAEVARIDHNLMLHHARGARLRAMPAGARRLLSAGCAGTWYFDWIRSRYGAVAEHLGIEAYMPRPDDLPPEVTWIANTAGHMPDVGDASVDLVFAGQTIEHLWPEEVAGFLAESARVLRPGGHLVMDSPNRLLTEPLLYSMGEHTVELTPDEAVELATLGGFEVTRLAGIWLARDPRTLRVLPFDANTADDEWPVAERLVAAEAHPDHAFIWWLEARRTGRAPDHAALRARAEAIFAQAWPERNQRLIPYAGRVVERRGADEEWVRAAAGAPGFVIYGPYMPLRPGHHRVTFRLEWEGEGPAPGAVLDIAVGDDARVLARREAAPGEREVTLEATLDRLEFSGQFRCASTGGPGFAVRRRVEFAESPR